MYLVCGDWHGDTAEAYKQLAIAQQIGATRIIQVGDFGFFWPGQKGHKYMRKVQYRAEQVGIPIYVLDGNHENFDKLYELPIEDDGLRHIGPYLKHMPRGYTWESHGHKFVAVGGAYSIDKQDRLRYEQRGRGKVWWPQETLTNSEVDEIRRVGKVDVAFTHDCAPNFPMLKGYKDDPESVMHQQKLAYVMRELNPSLWLHGHMHYSIQYQYPDYGDWSTRVISLARDGMEQSSIVLDPKTLETYYPKVTR